MDMDVTKYIDALDIKVGGTWRGECPSCHKSNTFSVKRDLNGYIWNCYSASCSLRGGCKTSATGDDLKALLLRGDKDNRHSQPFTQPSYFSTVQGRPLCQKYIKDNHLAYAINKGLVKVRWDTLDRRFVFLVENEYGIVDAVGRSLTNSGPKWKRYGKSREPFTVGSAGTCIVVEDCASACAITRFDYSGVALMGTSLTNEHKSAIRRKYKRAVIALDKDASVKALNMRQELRVHVPTSYLLLERDIKYLDDNELEELLGGIDGEASPVALP